MDNCDWDSVLQFTSDSVDHGFYEQAEGPRKADLTPNHLQIPTPPASHDGSPACEDPDDESNMLVSVSTTFFPGAQNHSRSPNLALLSTDSVFFYVHSPVLLEASDNAFRSLLPPALNKNKDENVVINVPETSAVLNIILHSIYDMSCAHYSPPFETLVTAVKRFPTYGLRPKARIAPSMPLFQLLLSHAPLFPLELYALASQFDLYELAVSTSSHLLSFQLSSLTDDMAERIGPVYLKRLFFLHFGRADALKRVLLPPPHPHAPTPWCDFTDQKTLTRAWALASAYLAWDARPDLSTSTVESALSPLAQHLTCDLCKQSLQDRIKNVIIQWSIVKRTI